MSGDPEDGAAPTDVVCRFVRGRNALLGAADFGALFMDCYLHLGQNGVVLVQGADEKFKLLLAALTLHAAIRPRAETCAWTLHLEEEDLNLFAVAENPTGHVIGQVFAENIRRTGKNVLHAETAVTGGERRRSVVDLAGVGGILAMAGEFYAQSEQRPARFFDLGGDDFAVLAAQPDCDLEWLRTVTPEEVRALWQDESRQPLETRAYRFCCGCTAERVAEAIAPALRGQLDEVYGDESFIRVSCPRCGTRHEITKSLFAPGPPA